MIGFTPAQVREMTLEDFDACVEGWNRAQGAGPPPTLSNDDYNALVSLGETFNAEAVHG